MILIATTLSVIPTIGFGFFLLILWKKEEEKESKARSKKFEDSYKRGIHAYQIKRGFINE